MGSFIYFLSFFPMRYDLFLFFENLVFLSKRLLKIEKSFWKMKWKKSFWKRKKILNIKKLISNNYHFAKNYYTSESWNETQNYVQIIFLAFFLLFLSAQMLFVYSINQCENCCKNIQFAIVLIQLLQRKVSMQSVSIDTIIKVCAFCCLQNYNKHVMWQLLLN